MNLKHKERRDTVGYPQEDGPKVFTSEAQIEVTIKPFRCIYCSKHLATKEICNCSKNKHVK